MDTQKTEVRWLQFDGHRFVCPKCSTTYNKRGDSPQVETWKHCPECGVRVK